MDNKTMNRRNLETAFEAALAQQLEKIAAAGISAGRLPAQAEKFGALAAVRQMISRHQLSDSFDALREAGHLELSAEALVTDKRFGELFSDEEVNHCFSALCEADFY